MATERDNAGSEGEGNPDVFEEETHGDLPNPCEVPNPDADVVDEKRLDEAAVRMMMSTVVDQPVPEE